MQEAATAFCNGEIDVDIESRSVTMSKIFKWYAADFGVEPHERLGVLATYATGEVSKGLQQLASSKGKLHFKYTAYDWSSNSK